MMEEEISKEDKEAASKLTCLEDVLEVVGSQGRWNVLLFVLCSCSTMCAAFVTMSYQFLGGTPDHWCRVEPLREANWTDQQILDVAIPFNNKTGQHKTCHMYAYNYTRVAQMGYEGAVTRLDDLSQEGVPKEVTCSTRDFVLTHFKSTVATEWDLVCERRVLYSTTQAANQLGMLIAAIVTPIFADKFGRRPMALCSATLAILQGIASCFSPSVEVFIALRCGLSIASMSVYLCLFLVVIELSTPATRSSFGSMFLIPWALGCMILPGIAYLIRPWRYLQAAISLPFVMYLITYRILPESPRWLLLKGRYGETVDILLRIAFNNRREVPPRTVLRIALTRIGCHIQEEQKQHGHEQDKNTGWSIEIVKEALQNVMLPYSTVQLAGRMFLLIVIWVCVSCSYYGISLNATNISADLYLYNFLGGLCELPSYFILWLMLVKTGRRPSLSGLFFVCAASIAVNSALMQALPDVPVAVKIALSLIGKIAIAAAFHLLYIYTAELFTTQQRSLAVGHCNFFGRIGSIASPYINDLLGFTTVWAPPAVYSTMAIISSLVPILLPETRHQILPEDDAHHPHHEEEDNSKKTTESSLSH